MEVVTLVTAVGEIIGGEISRTDTTITLKNPRLFVQTQEGAGFANGISYTGKMEPDKVEFNLSSVLTVVPSDPDAEKSWVSATSRIALL